MKQNQRLCLSLFHIVFFKSWGQFVLTQVCCTSRWQWSLKPLAWIQDEEQATESVIRLSNYRRWFYFQSCNIQTWLTLAQAMSLQQILLHKVHFKACKTLWWTAPLKNKGGQVYVNDLITDYYSISITIMLSMRMKVTMMMITKKNWPGPWSVVGAFSAVCALLWSTCTTVKKYLQLTWHHQHHLCWVIRRILQKYVIDWCESGYPHKMRPTRLAYHCKTVFMVE